jgi:hypothetical protein
MLVSGGSVVVLGWTDPAPRSPAIGFASKVKTVLRKEGQGAR